MTDHIIREMLLQKLTRKGMDAHLIPCFFRVLKSVLMLSPQVSLWQINRRLDYLGWPGFELDYHTLELALACMEAKAREAT